MSLISSKLIYGPSNSLDNIVQYYGRTPSPNGSTIPDIVEIRELLFDISEGSTLLNSIVITAPHTHWKSHNPITYFLENESYAIGPHDLNDNDNYFPVSFIFGKYMPVPYEWILCSSIEIDSHELVQCVNYIVELNSKLHNKDIPFGAAIDFRFKEKLSDESKRSLEIPDERNHDFSIIKNETLATRQLDDNVEQVSWHSFSDRFYGFDAEELLALNTARDFLNNLDDNKKQVELIDNLKQSFRH